MMSVIPHAKTALIGSLPIIAELMARPAWAEQALICFPRETWMEFAPSTFQYVDQCGPRTWWRFRANDWRLVRTGEREDKICIMGDAYIPIWQQSCPEYRTESNV
jgi:hypothetical protein